MAKSLEIRVESDHLESLTRTTAIGAISELIWNSLDADATRIFIQIFKNPLAAIEEITISDNGHGLEYRDADAVFSTLGGSLKKKKAMSPKRRLYHGKEGKGRYKSLALGNLVEFSSRFKTADGQIQSFTLKLDRNNLKKVSITDPVGNETMEGTGFTVSVRNLNEKAIAKFNESEIVEELEKLLAVYYSAYPDFEILFNGTPLSFSALIKKTAENVFTLKDGEETLDFTIRLIEWNKECDKRLYYCNCAGVCYAEDKIGIRSRFPVTLYILSDYVETLRQEQIIDLKDTDTKISEATNRAREFARDYIRNRLHESSREFIDELKREEIYPYTTPIQKNDSVESAKRKVFDIVALQVNEFVPSFNDQDKPNKKLTLTLLKQALETNATGLQKILHEVIKLPDEKIAELSEILEKTSLDCIIDVMSEITDRIRTIYEIRQLLFDKKFKKSVKERKHLQKILIHETWLFGDDYTLGAQDMNLRNVLRAHLKYLGRDDFEEAMAAEAEISLDDIPDICLFKQYSLGEQGRFKHLVIEIKRPSKTISGNEIQQILKYATAVQKDARFDKENTKWVFYLLATELDEYAEMQCSPTDRAFGHILKAQNLDVYVYRWNRLLSEAEARHQYLKDKLNLNILENEAGILLLKQKYAQFLPEAIADE